jgi:hypothetical protein
LGRRTTWHCVSRRDQHIEELNRHLLVDWFAIHQLVQLDRPIVEPPLAQDWGLDDNILFSSNGALMRIPAAGGAVQTLATPDPKKKEIFYLSAQLLPGGKQVLFGIALASDAPGRGGSIAALNLRTGEKSVLVQNVAAAPRYVPTRPGSSVGYIVYYTSLTGSLMAVAFDASRMEVKGSPVPVLDGVQALATVHSPCWGSPTPVRWRTWRAARALAWHRN